jgi:hypothetical protein
MKSVSGIFEFLFYSSAHFVHEIECEGSSQKLQRDGLGAVLLKQVLWTPGCCLQFEQAAILPNELQHERAQAC